MAALDDLISQIPDESLRERIRAEVKRANRQKKFGLVFEEHLPEATPLYDIPVKRGSVVATKDGQVTDIYYVEKIEDGQAACFHKATKERVVLPVDALVCVAQFGEPIYPYLQPLDTVCNAPDSDLWHTLIEADNYHALQLLEYLYAGKVDCIYIDPPYNTGARDWKYNNDYVDGNDTYRHSKWLSMMEKRLRIAKRLLNPAESVLIVTIDEKEYLHLGCLLEELFPEARIQMVSSVINRKGVAKAREFSRCDEYLFFVMMGEAGPALTDDNMLDSDGNSTPSGTTWLPMRRAGTNSLRKDRPRLCYPIYADVKTERIVKVGEFLPPEEKIENNYRITDGLVEIWPVKTNGDEGRWQLQGDTVMSRVSMGTVKAVPKSNGTWTIQYLNEGALKEIDEGTLVVTGRDANGVLIVERSSAKSVAAKSIWNNFRLPETISIERSNVGEAYTDHLFVDNATGKAVINLNNWEKAVLQAERGRSDYICWLRNPPRKSWSLCIPYEQNAEKKSMYPDFLIIRKDEMGFVIDILEPHDGTRTDNLGKAKGFAEYARQNPGVGRLQLIRLLNGRIKRLDMSRSAVRDRVSHAMSNDELDHIFDEDGFFG